MKCMNCGQENKETAKTCRKCSRNLAVPPAWFPDWKWHIKTLGTIYAVLILAYFGISFFLRSLPQPYQVRKIPIEVTPWLRKGNKFLSDEDLRAPGEDPAQPPTAASAAK